MKIQHIVLCIALMAVFAGCDVFDIGSGKDPYSKSLHTLTVSPVFPEGSGLLATEGLEVNVEDIDKGHSYVIRTGKDGKASVSLPDGNYRITVSELTEELIFNGSADKIIIDGKDKAIDVNMAVSKKGALIIKEIYCGGCQAYPQQGRYFSDSYIIVHNNSSDVEYLDNLCLGTLDPYNATGTNVWIEEDPETGATVFNDFVPVIQAVWKIGGDGTEFPLDPGEDAVICVLGAIDHTVTYPQSVNLNRPGYFVCYDNVLFDNTKYHPVPGTEISEDRYLKVVIKTGKSNAYTFSVSSPAVVLFRAQGQTIEDFVENPDNVVQKPGSSADRVVKVPVDWVLDGVEVFTGNTAGNVKRLGPYVDAGYVAFSAPFLRHTLHRLTDEKRTAEAGYEVLKDTNNSSADFFERTSQSLNDK